jgi:hypothetical protein
MPTAPLLLGNKRDDGTQFLLTFFVKRNCWFPSTVVRVQGLLLLLLLLRPSCRTAPVSFLRISVVSDARRRCVVDG